MRVNISQFAGPIVAHIINPILLLITALATFYFIWGVAGLFWGGDDADGRKKAQNHILYGVIGLFIMVAVYGIIRVIAATIGLDDPFTTTGFGGF